MAESLEPPMVEQLAVESAVTLVVLMGWMLVGMLVG
jgi:hypothetical protein